MATDRTLLLGADLFFGLFGAFVAIHGTAPDEPYGLPERTVLKLEWPMEGTFEASCLLAIGMEVGGVPVDLDIPDLTMGAAVDGTCRWQRLMEVMSAGEAVISVTLPYASGCLSIQLASADPTTSCQSPSGTSLRRVELGSVG